MALRTTIIAGVFEQEYQARRALSALKRAGFRYDQVGVASQSNRAGDLFHEFLNLGVPEESSRFYDQEYRAGRIVVSVRPDGRDQEAQEILRSNGAYDYEQRTATAYDRTASEQVATGDVGDADVEDEYHRPRSLKLREERLEINKESVQTGEVQLHKEVVTEQQALAVPVTHEEVIIERRPIPGGQLAADPIGDDEIFRIPVLEEQVNVTKLPVITDEITVGKRPVQETRTISETVKREEARIEQQGDVPLKEMSYDNRQTDARDGDLS